MSAQPFDTHFTPRELAVGGYLAAALRLAAVALLVLLVCWSLDAPAVL